VGGTLTDVRAGGEGLNRLEQRERRWGRGGIDTYSKKMKATLGREKTKILTNLAGIRKMEKLPGVMFIIDTRREHIAVKEAKKMGVTTIALIDTDSDPDLIDLPIPGNDDAMRAIDLIMKELADAAIDGRQGRNAQEAKQGGDEARRRSTRTRFKADDGKEAPLGEAQGEASDAPASETAPTPPEPTAG